jgi:hypothetical protein
MAAGPKRRGRIETRQRAAEEFLKLLPILPLPPHVAATVADCVRAGIRPGQGRGRGSLSDKDELARAAAMAEAPAFHRRYLAEAKASGAHRNPRSWAREKTAEDVRRRMIELGVRSPPAIATLVKRMKLS